MNSLLQNPATLVKNEDRRIGDASLVILGFYTECSMVGLQVAIQKAEFGDYPTALVREQRKADFRLVGKLPENLGRVVANTDQPDVVALKLGENLLQLDELRFAVSSPTRASEEDDERFAPCTPSVK